VVSQPAYRTTAALPPRLIVFGTDLIVRVSSLRSQG
jgi:hypothetical protein